MGRYLSLLLLFSQVCFGSAMVPDGAITQKKLASQVFNPTSLMNLGFTAVGNSGTHAFTITLTQADGATAPTTLAPVKVAFRNSTAATGGYNVRSITSALTLTIPSTATLGHLSSTQEYLWIYMIDNGGTPELAVSGGFVGNEGTVKSTIALTGGLIVRNQLYSNILRASVPFRLVGRASSLQTTAGTWNSNAVEISIWPFATPIGSVTKSQRIEYGVFTGGGGGVTAVYPGTAWVAGTSRGSAGVYSLTFTTSLFSATPICFATGTNEVANGWCEAISTGAGDVSYEHFSNNTTTVDGNCAVMCIGDR